MQQLKYTDTGKGIVLILIHGFCESKEIWNEYQKDLSGRYRVIAPDLPGFGESLLDSENVTMEYYAQKIHNLVTSLNLKDIIMVGHSLGGYVTLAFAEKYHALLKGFVLFHSSAFPDTEDRKANRTKTMEFVRRNGSAPFVQTLIPSLFTEQNNTLYRERIKELIEKGSLTDPEGIIGASYAMRERKDRTEVLKSFTKPVLFIIGKEDKAVPLESSVAQCSLPNHSLAYFLGETAHMGMIEKKYECLGILSDFISICNLTT